MMMMMIMIIMLMHFFAVSYTCCTCSFHFIIFTLSPKLTGKPRRDSEWGYISLQYQLSVGCAPTMYKLFNDDVMEIRLSCWRRMVFPYYVLLHRDIYDGEALWRN